MRKIFYADDDCDDIETFVTAVKELDEITLNKIELQVYSSGTELLKDLKALKPKDCIIFLDINMPQKNGFEILTEIRTDNDLCTLPVIMYSTAFDGRTINTSQELGASLYAVKPYSITDIANLIKMVTEIHWEGYNAQPADFVINKSQL
jgi:CheY-like chemotaxis protein